MTGSSWAAGHEQQHQALHIQTVRFGTPVLAVGEANAAAWVALAPRRLGGSGLLGRVSRAGHLDIVGAIGSNPISVAATTSSIWVANGEGPLPSRSADSVMQFSLRDGRWRRVATVHIPQVAAVAASSTTAWAAVQDGSSTKIVTATGKPRVLATLVDNESVRMCFADGSLFVASTGNMGRSFLTRIDVRSGRRTALASIDGVVVGLAPAHGGGVWVTTDLVTNDGFLVFYRGSSTRRYRLHGITRAVAGDQRAAWVITGPGVLHQVLVSTGQVARSITLPTGIDAITAVGTTSLLATDHLVPPGYLISLR